MTSSSAGQAFYVDPPGGPGPGVLVLHSWWGLTDGVRNWCRQLASQGFTVLAPDLMLGLQPETGAEAQLELSALSPDETAHLVVSSIASLRHHAGVDTVGVVGFSMGGSWALWAATRWSQWVDSCVVYGATQDIDFTDLVAPVLVHFAESDSLVGDDQRVEMEAHLRLLGKSVEVYSYPNTNEFFAEPSQPSFDEAAAAVAFERTVAHLRRD